MTRRPAAALSELERTAGQASVGFEVALARRIDYLRRQLRRGRVAVPAAGMALDIEPVAQRLLVEAGLRLAGLVAVGRPEARAVGRHHLVDQHDLARPPIPRNGAAELELGVGDDDAVLERHVAALGVDRARQPLEL